MKFLALTVLLLSSTAFAQEGWQGKKDDQWIMKESSKKSAVAKLGNIIDEFGLRLGPSTMNHTHEQTNVLSVDFKGSFKSSDGEVEWFPFQAVLQYDLSAKGSEDTNLLIDKLTVHLFGMTGKFNKTGNLDFKLKVRALGISHNEDSLGRLDKPDIKNDAENREFLRIEPEIIIDLDNVAQTMKLTIKGYVASGSQVASVEQSYIENNPEVASEIASRNGDYNMRYRSNFDYRLDAALRATIEIHGVMMGYEVTGQKFSRDQVDVYTYTDGVSDTAEFPVHVKNNFVTHTLYAGYRLGKRHEIGIFAQFDKDFKDLFSGVRYKLHLGEMN